MGDGGTTGMIMSVSIIPNKALTCGGMDLALKPIMATNKPLMRINGSSMSARN
jgi:hypothetical protein